MGKRKLFPRLRASLINQTRFAPLYKSADSVHVRDTTAQPKKIRRLSKKRTGWKRVAMRQRSREKYDVSRGNVLVIISHASISHPNELFALVHRGLEENGHVHGRSSDLLVNKSRASTSYDYRADLTRIGSTRALRQSSIVFRPKQAVGSCNFR